ncbi:winged helix-turn-helix domain-containing protein [Pseudomonas kurunegalensis]|uniref:winged helix-turn-helix domain-containing protein n=1 Tax=Pseudomonas kurunegalensis TaxID=485880 RepID=UPI00355924A4
MFGFSYADICLSALTRQVVCNARCVRLKPTGFNMLVFLMENAEQIVSRESLLFNVWGYSFDPGTKILEVQLNYLRKNLVTLQSSIVIQTIRGRGLRLYRSDVR